MRRRVRFPGRVVAAPGVTQYANEPPGLVTPYTITAPQPYSFDEMPRWWDANDGKPWYALDDHGWCLEVAGQGESGDRSRWSIVNDAERGNCLQIDLLAGDPGGVSPPGAAIAGFGHGSPLSSGGSSPFVARQLFLAYWVKLSASWSDPNVAMKHCYFFNSLSDGDWYINLSSPPQDGGTNGQKNLNVGWQVQIPCTATNDHYLNWFPNDVWHKYEMYAKYNSANAASDGVLKIWVDGVNYVDRSDMRIGCDGRDFDWLKFGIITGGGSNQVAQNQSVRFDDWYVKVGT